VSAGKRHSALIRDEMSTSLLVVSSGASLETAAALMAEAGTSSALVDRGEGPGGYGIVTARDLCECVGRGGAAAESVNEHFTAELTAAAPDASLERAAELMSSGGFRHLPIVEGGEAVGIVSMRDVVRRWLEEDTLPGPAKPIRDAMRTDLVRLGREDTLREAARLMTEHVSGAVVVEAARRWRPPGIVTERDIVRSVGAGQPPDEERLAHHLAPRMTFSAPDWSLRQAAEAMTKGGFQDVVVVDESGPIGVIAMRDVVRAWLGASGRPT